MNTDSNQPRIRGTAILTAALGLALASCATRESRATLGSAWKPQEPEVNLSAYESVQKRPGQRKDVAFAVAISGGGMRAANFAAGVLKALEQIPVRGENGASSNLLREVDYFSTVSGGGLAAGSYIAHLDEYQQTNPADTNVRGFSFAGHEKSDGRNWHSALSKNYQSSLVGSFFNPLMAGPLDRGDILEMRLDESILGRHRGRSMRLSDIFVPKGQTPMLPYWVTNATVYENGAIFPFTPDILATYGINGFNHRLRHKDLEVPGDMPLAVGMKTSASFPVAIPPTSLKANRDPRHPRLHLMDGGVADNLGVITALRLLSQDKAPKKVLLVIDAYNGIVEPFSNMSHRPGMFSSALRNTSISLDSAHQRVDTLLRVAGGKSISYAVIDFSRALEAANEEATPMTDQVFSTLGINSLRRDETSPQSLQAIFTQAIGVGTWFKIDPKSQEALLKAGENALFIPIRKAGEPVRVLPGVGKIRAAF